MPTRVNRHRIVRIVQIGFVALMATVSPSLQAIADDRVEGAGLAASDAGGVGTFDFVAPPTAYRVVYFFTGATTQGSAVATSVHCTSLGSVVTPVRVEFYDFAGTLRGVGNLNLGPFRTATFTASQTGLTAFYFDDVNVPLPVSLNQGVVRVLRVGSVKIICTAQVLDAVGATPSFVVSLPHFGPSGVH
jgi:hypothetical protein